MLCWRKEGRQAKQSSSWVSFSCVSFSCVLLSCVLFSGHITSGREGEAACVAGQLGACLFFFWRQPFPPPTQAASCGDPLPPLPSRECTRCFHDDTTTSILELDLTGWPLTSSRMTDDDQEKRREEEKKRRERREREEREKREREREREIHWMSFTGCLHQSTPHSLPTREIILKLNQTHTQTHTHTHTHTPKYNNVAS